MSDNHRDMVRRARNSLSTQLAKLGKHDAGAIGVYGRGRSDGFRIATLIVRTYIWRTSDYASEYEGFDSIGLTPLTPDEVHLIKCKGVIDINRMMSSIQHAETAHALSKGNKQGHMSGYYFLDYAENRHTGPFDSAQCAAFHIGSYAMMLTDLWTAMCAFSDYDGLQRLINQDSDIPF